MREVTVDQLAAASDQETAVHCLDPLRASDREVRTR